MGGIKMATTTKYCEKCNRTIDENEFYQSKNLEKHPDGRVNLCKRCYTMFVDNWDPRTFIPLLEDIDIPYVKEEWDVLLEKHKEHPEKLTGNTILGKYISKMKLRQWKDYRYADTPKIRADLDEKKRFSLQRAGYSEDEIAEIISRGEKLPEHPAIQLAGAPSAQPPAFVYQEEADEFDDKLTDEDKLYLKMKWGKNYKSSEYVRLEQLWKDMMDSYDIQTAGHKDTLIMICKASLKANELIDANDLEGFQKVSKVYDSLMKSGAFTGAQNKTETGECIDSIGELVQICETEGFIPRYYVDGPQDKVDRTLEDLQNYTRSLVMEESNLGNLIENSMKEIEADKKREASADVDDEEVENSLEDELFKEKDDSELTDIDFMELDQLEEGQELDDEEYYKMLGEGGES